MNYYLDKEKYFEIYKMSLGALLSHHLKFLQEGEELEEVVKYSLGEEAAAMTNQYMEDLLVHERVMTEIVLLMQEKIEYKNQFIKPATKKVNNQE